jgi:Ca2+-binding EF-hand superfamily protein
MKSKRLTLLFPRFSSPSFQPYRDKDKTDKGLALEQKKLLESKQAVKLLQEQKKAGMRRDEELDEAARVADPELDALWARVRDFLADVSGTGEKKDTRGTGTANKLRLTEACRVYDPKGSGVISKRSLEQAFVTARLTPALTETELDQLTTALDAWHQRAAGTVSYNAFLQAPYAREPVSVRGLFPKVQASGPSKTALERKAKADEEERKAQEALEEERRRREEALSKRAGGAQGPASRARSKEDPKRAQQEEQRRREAAKREAERLEKLEEEAVTAEVSKIRSVVTSIQAKVRERGEDVRKWFSMFDADRNSRLDHDELAKVLLHAGVRLPERDLKRVYNLLDGSGDGRVSYTEFCDLVESKRVPDYRAFIKAERAKQKAQAEEEAKQAQAASGGSQGAEVGSAQISRDQKVGRVDGLSSIMARSVFEQRSPPKLLEEGDHLRVQEEIKELLRVNADGKPTTFDDLLAMMGAPRFRKEGQVSLSEFQTVIARAGGGQKFSAHEVKQVFSIHAVDPPTQGPEAAAGAAEPYIPVRDFKDKFLPALTWKRDDARALEQASRGSGKPSASSTSKTESLAIDHILDGRRPHEIMRETEGKERQPAKQLDKTQGGKLEPVAESRSEVMSQDSRVSKPIEDVVGAKWGDPRKKIAQRQQLAQRQAAAATGAKGTKAGELSKEALREHDAR